MEKMRDDVSTIRRQLADNRWVIRKDISVGNILTIVTFTFFAVTAYFNMDKRLSIVEEANARQVMIDKTQDEERRALRNEFHERFNKVDDKLEYIIRNVVIKK